ncbi:ABC transporter ATP-binding protein [Schaalia odontolytica]|uniref:ABC transporter ATP-binding protein n=1 Tax=Schaalia odontolytica TaxID=1660 RepID=UPI0028D420B2|nr:ABC transporter ATP-binding protein [Schaalia odontolytica]
MSRANKKNNLGALARTLRLVGPDVRPHRGLIAGGMTALLLDVVFRVMEPWPMKIVVDSVVEVALHRGDGPWSAAPMILACAALLVVIVGLRAASNYAATVCFALVGSRVAQSLRSRVFRHVQGLSQQFHARNRSADTVQRIVGDVNRLQEVAITAGLPLLANTATLLVMLVVMIVLDPLLAIVVVVAVALFLFVSRGSSQRITAAARRTCKGEGQLANTAQESLASMPVVQAYGLEDYIADRFGGANSKAVRQGVKSLRLAARLERSTDLLVGIATAVVLVGGGLRVLGGAMGVGDLVLFTSYLRTAMKPLRDMAKYTGRISRAGASGERVADLMEVRQDIVSTPGALSPSEIGADLVFDRVVTQYDGVEILHSLSLSVGEGERVAIIGPSGSGKSTLVSLAVRAQDPVSGRVLMGGYPLTELTLEAVRSNVTLLHQDAVLFATSIRENIRLGREGASDDEIVAAAKAANAHDFIMEMPGGYDAEVGERGGTLSGGQRQRIAIARALLRDTPIIILDEATTGLDPESTGLVLDAIDGLVAGRTALAITHDPPVALRSSRVVWIEDGRVLLDGTPDQLLATSDAFREWASSATANSTERKRP